MLRTWEFDLGEPQFTGSWGFGHSLHERSGGRGGGGSCRGHDSMRPVAADSWALIYGRSEALTIGLGVSDKRRYVIRIEKI